jgi:hypothetical protein
MTIPVVQAGDALTITLTLRNTTTDALIDISSQTAMSIVLQGSTDNTRLTQSATFPTGDDGTQGRLTATFSENEICALGRWSAQGDVTLGTGRYRTTKAFFQVEEIL